MVRRMVSAWPAARSALAKRPKDFSRPPEAAALASPTHPGSRRHAVTFCENVEQVPQPLKPQVQECLGRLAHPFCYVTFFRSVHTNFKRVGPPGVTVKCADFIILALVCPMIVRGGGEQKKHPKTKKIEFSSGGGVV